MAGISRMDFTPEIRVEELAGRLKSSDPFILLDVREPWELDIAKIADGRLRVRPMSRLAKEGLQALQDLAESPGVEIYVLCHHGVRSADVTKWLSFNGWTNVFSVAGGIDEYARKIDQSVGMY